MDRRRPVRSGGVARAGQFPDESGRVGPGRQLGHQLQDFPLRPVRGPREDAVAVGRREVRGEPGDGAHVQPAVGEHGEDDRVLAGGTSRGDSQVRLGLGEMQDLGAVREHRGAGVAREETALVHLGEVSDELGLGVARLAEQIRDAPQQLVVGQRARKPWREQRPNFEARRQGTQRRTRVRGAHDWKIRRVFATADEARRRAPPGQDHVAGLEGHAVTCRGILVPEDGRLWGISDARIRASPDLSRGRRRSNETAMTAPPESEAVKRACPSGADGQWPSAAAIRRPKPTVARRASTSCRRAVAPSRRTLAHPRSVAPPRRAAGACVRAPASPRGALHRTPLPSC